METATSLAGQYLSSDDQASLVALRRMKALALGLLIGVLCLALLAHWQYNSHPVWPFVAAFAEAATVGAMADWFAVTALFRHPLGLPIWHTAIIPRSKSRIARNLGSFIVEHFFTVEALRLRLAAYNPAAHAAAWLCNPAVSPRIAQALAHALVAVVSSLESSTLSRLLSRHIATAMAALDVATLSARALDTLLAQGRQHELIDAVLAGMVRKLDDEAVRERIAALLTEALHLEDVKVMGVSLGGTLRPLVRSGVERLMGRLQDELNAAAQDAGHPWRAAVDAYLAECALRLKGDARWRARVENTVAALVADPALEQALDPLWRNLQAWLTDDSRHPDSQLAKGCHTLVQAFGERLHSDDKLQGRINRRLLALLPAFVGYYRTTIAIFISDKLDSWSPQEVSSRIELAIGRDLQYIRINGTLVGGMIGLVLFSLSRLLHG